MKATINASLELSDYGHLIEDITLEGSLGLHMTLLAIIIDSIEKKLPEEKRAQFRADMLETINDIRKERSNVYT